MNISDICTKWSNGKLPIINGIVYSSGYADEIYVEYDQVDYRDRIIVRGDKIEFSSFFPNEESAVFSSVSIYKEVVNEEKGIKVYCGGGSYGGDGYILVETIKKEIIWFAFFENSNEFESCEIIGNSIVVHNNLNEKWVFDIDDPASFEIFI